jgi:hypothetical protein
MRLTAPKQITWIIAVILGVVGIVGELATGLGIQDAAFWIVLVGLALMLLATYIKGL